MSKGCASIEAPKSLVARLQGILTRSRQPDLEELPLPEQPPILRDPKPLWGVHHLVDRSGRLGGRNTIEGGLRWVVLEVSSP
jgi:hypothetical protein